MPIGDVRQRDLRRGPFDELNLDQGRAPARRCICVLAHDVPTLDTLARPGTCSHERREEVEVLLEAITALHRADILTVAEYESKRQQLTDRL